MHGNTMAHIKASSVWLTNERSGHKINVPNRIFSMIIICIVKNAFKQALDYNSWRTIHVVPLYKTTLS